MPSRVLPAGAQGQTNDLGEFRVSGLPPGEYYIVATPRGRSPFGGPAVDLSTPRNARTTIAATFYPGTVDEAAAQPVSVAAGAEVANISFTMQSSPAFRISGIVVDEKGEPVSGAMVMLMPDPRRMVLFSGGGGGQSQADGRFTIGDVTAGTYRLSASVPIMMGGRGAGGGGAGVVGGSWVSTDGGGGSATVMRTFGAAPQPTELTVTDANVSGVRVVVQRPAPQ